jgi:hypothetical protein
MLGAKQYKGEEYAPRPQRRARTPRRDRQLFTSCGARRSGAATVFMCYPVTRDSESAQPCPLPAHDLARIIHDADARFLEVSNIHSIVITEDLEQGRRPKTTGSRRVVPVHPN